MNKKKMYTMAGGLALVAAIGVGSTLAYFTDRDTANNVVELGKVDITLTEPTYDANGGNNGDQVKGVNPGDVIQKDPTVTVDEGSNPAYIRVHVDFRFADRDLDVNEDRAIRDLLELNDGWIEGDNGYYYYQNVVEYGDGEHKVFDEVTIPSSWGNDYVNKTLHIDVTAEAVQAANVEDLIFDENGQITDWDELGEITELNE